MLKSVDFGQFMTSEGTDTLFLGSTSKTGQSVAHNRHGIFLFGFFCQRMDIFRHFISLISDSRSQDTRDRTKQIGFIASFNRF